MSTNRKTTEVDVDFIRLFFRSPSEEHIAVQWAHLLASFIGDQALMLLPHTTLSEIFSWVESCSDDAVEFVLAVEEEFGLDLDVFVGDLEHMTFGQFVEYAARRQTHVA